jgi:succinyl-diaminopimelate desuccinylase
MTPTPEKLLRELIAIPSVNPALPADADWTGECRMADFLAHQGDRAGLEIEFQEVTNQRRNILSRLTPPGGRPKRRVLMAPHMDTVGVDGPQRLKPRRQGDRLFGRGACDTKGSVAAMLTALLRLANNGPRPIETEILFVGLVDEEVGQTGSRAFARSAIKADLAIVGEPTGNKLVTAHKGDCWLTLSTKGKAAHGSRPELGVNATVEAAKAVQLLESDYAAQLRERRHSLLGSPSVNVGVLRGGRQPNIVPDHCEIVIDRRTIPGETSATVQRELKQLFRTAGLKVTVEPDTKNPCLPLETSPDLPLVRQLMKILRQREPRGVDYFCDASPLAAGGIPSVVFGPGNIAQAHTVDEWISLKSLNRAADQLETFLRGQP